MTNASQIRFKLVSFGFGMERTYTVGAIYGSIDDKISDNLHLYYLTACGLKKIKTNNPDTLLKLHQM